MKIDKAIERLETFIERHPSAGYSDLIPAIQLGIEAMKRLHVLRLISTNEDAHLLPGETDETT